MARVRQSSNLCQTRPFQQSPSSPHPLLGLTKARVYNATIRLNRGVNVPGVFISYRREDSAAYAGRLFDVLSTEFGQENTFMDVDDIKGGDNFVTVIDRNLDVSDALLAVIGRHWLS